MPKPKTLREIPFEQIEDEFDLAVADMRPYGDLSPAVGPRREGGYYVRVIASRRFSAGSVNETYDYFYLDDDGTVTQAPRGYAKDYKPGRITGLDEAVAKCSEAAR